MEPTPIFDLLHVTDLPSSIEAYKKIAGTAFYTHALEEVAGPASQALVDALCAGDYT